MTMPPRLRTAGRFLVAGFETFATYVAIAMLILATVTVAKQGFGNRVGEVSTKLSVEIVEANSSAANPDDLFDAPVIGARSIVPELAETWLRIQGFTDSRPNQSNLIVFPNLQVHDGNLWLYERTSPQTARRVSQIPISLEKIAIGSSARIEVSDLQSNYFGMLKVTPKMPRIITAEQVSFGLLQVREGAFERYGGALIGMFLSLAAFSFVVGVMNRDSTFLVFSGWLITSYRLAAVNAGYDIGWIAGMDPADLSGQLILRATFAAHGFLTIALFRRLFSASAHRYILAGMTACQIGFVILLCTVSLHSHVEFFRASWVVAGAALLLQVAGVMGAITSRNASGVYLPALAWCVSIAGSLLQIALTSGLLSRSIPFVNAQTASFASGFLIAIALADRLRLERRARLDAQAKALSALTQFRETYTSVPIGLFTLNSDSVFVQTNPSFEEMFGNKVEPRLADRNWTDLFVLTDLSKLRTELTLKQKAVLEVQGMYEKRWYRIRAHVSGLLIEGSIEDITSRREAREKLQRMVDHDSLTDLLNRRGLDLRLNELVSKISLGFPCSLAFMDMDRFKLVNDMFGHDSGDSVLKEIAERIRSFSETGAIVSRVGGDEFVILFPNCTAITARQNCARLLSEVNDRPFTIADKQFCVVASIGLIALTESMSPNFAVSAADRACADAKRQGGNRIVTYGETDRELQNHVAEMDMVSKMHSKLPVERMKLLVQPIVSLQAPFSNLSYEALLRVVDDSGKLAPPTPLIQAAERHGFISRLDRWVVESMITWLNEHPEHRDRLNYCAVNLSGASLNDERFLADILSMVSANPEAAKRICFEITETVALYDLKNSCRFVDAVRSRGSKVALDDFGAGYTSFNYLKSLQANLVKIDGSFVKTIDTDRSNYAITRTIVDLTHEMGMSCVAEWVENAKIVELLAEMGVDYGQGWALAKPQDMQNLLAVQNCGELVTELAVLNVLQKDREPVFRRPVRHLQGTLVQMPSSLPR